MARRKDIQRVRAGRGSSKRVQRWLRAAHQRTHRRMGTPHRARVVDRVRQGSHPGDHPRNLLLTAARTIDWALRHHGVGPVLLPGSTEEGNGPMSNATEQARETAVHTRELLEDIWEAIDQGGEYEDTDAMDYLDELPLEVVWEVGEPFAVVLGTGGPHVEITGGGRSSGYELTVYWGGAEATVYGDAIDRTGDYFRDMYESM